MTFRSRRQVTNEDASIKRGVNSGKTNYNIALIYSAWFTHSLRRRGKKLTMVALRSQNCSCDLVATFKHRTAVGFLLQVDFRSKPIGQNRLFIQQMEFVYGRKRITNLVCQLHGDM